MKKTIFLATMIFASAGVFAMESTSGADKGGVKESVATSDPRKQVMRKEFNQLMEAVKSNNLNEVCKIIENHPDKSKIPDLLLYGKNKARLSKDQLEQVRRKLYQNSYVTELVNLSNEKGNFPLLIAVENGNKEIVKYLVAHGADVNKKDKSGNTPLLKACCSGKENIVKVLVEYGADVKKEYEDGETLLFAAIRSKNVDLVEYLIDQGVDVNKKNKKGVTPLKYIIKNYWPDSYKTTELESIIELLVKYGADANETTCLGYSVLSYSLGTLPNPINLVKTLVDHKAEINVLCTGVPCVDGRTTTIFFEKKTPLDIAEKRGFTEIIEYLKGKGAKSANDLSSDF